MFLKKENKNDSNVFMDDLMPDLPNQIMSEGIIKRDNHFHNCWMLLKQRRPDLWTDMTRVELTMSGYNPDEIKEDLAAEEKSSTSEGEVM